MEEKPVESLNYNLRIGFGVLLLVIGIIGVIWIASLLISLVSDMDHLPDEIPFVSKLVEVGRDSAPIRSAEKEVLLPDIIYYILGIFIYLLILGLAVALVKACLEGGTHLLHDKVDKILGRLNREVNKLKKG